MCSCDDKINDCFNWSVSCRSPMEKLVVSLLKILLVDLQDTLYIAFCCEMNFWLFGCFFGYHFDNFFLCRVCHSNFYGIVIFIKNNDFMFASYSFWNDYQE